MVYCIEAGYANTYLIEEHEGFIAVDVGTRLAAEKVFQFMSSKGRSGSDALRFITATHFHIDHIGGIGRLRELCPDVPVHFHHQVSRYLTGEDALSVPAVDRWIFGLAPTVFKIGKPIRNAYNALKSEKKGIPLPLAGLLNKVPYDPVCDFKDSVPLYPSSRWIILETPGHTPDSISFYCEKEKTLISGDTILNMEGKGELNRFCASWDEIRNSYERLLSLDVETICPGHGIPIVGVKRALFQVNIKPL